MNATAQLSVQETGISSELAKALFEWQCNAPEIPLDGSVSFKNTQFKYAKLSTILKIVRPVLKEAKLGFVQQLNGLEVVTRLFHTETGDFIESRLEIEASKDPKQQGAAITYARRYALVTSLGIMADEDSDAPQAKADEKPVFNEQHKLKVLHRVMQGEDMLDKCLQTFTMTAEQVREIIGAEKLAEE